MIRQIFTFFLCLGCAAALATCGSLYWLIVVNPGTEIEISNIENILGKESPVFYRDNVTKLGVFFDQAHRQYVRYGDIPVSFVDALIAAEDNSFFKHFGFDVFGIARAALKNIEAGKVVQGGSTLTQQAAKNLFKRTGRSFKAKARELLFALRLEYRYPKEKIFEFYANQFYVSGNGHGLGVAARYYFDKNPSELNLVECAFIAGSVKRPNYYNPFTKKSKEDEELARDRGAGRMRYVLNKMLELEMIDQQLYSEALSAPLSFKQGQVGYSLDYVMEMVKDAVSSTEVLAELKKNGIDNVSTSGIRIVTTVDKNTQENALYALRHDLSRLDVMLRGYEREEVQAEYAEIDYTGDNKLVPGAFLFGTITCVSGKGDEVEVTVDFAKIQSSATIDNTGLARIVAARVKWLKNLWAQAAKKDSDHLVKQLRVGDRIWVSVREVTSSGKVFLELEKYPQVQGAAMVMKDGAIRAMVGGTENRFYNRAVYAKRSMGSSFKPFVFAAAMQLGWSSSDLLRNSRDVFVFHNQPYFPRPDHISPYEKVSMNWAGVKSENLASVWLLTHLCDQIDPVQFRDLADHLGLTPRNIDGQAEPYSAYRSRIRDRYGIVVNSDVLRKAAYEAVVRNSEADFMQEDMAEEYTFFTSLHYGLGFESFSEQIDEDLAAATQLKDHERRELLLRKQLLSKNFLVLEELRGQLLLYRNLIDHPLGSFRPSLYSDDTEGAELYYDHAKKRYVFQLTDSISSGLDMVNRGKLNTGLASLSEQEQNGFWQDVLLNGEVSVQAFDLLGRQMEAELQRLQDELPYSFEVLSEVKDFRIYVGLEYLIALAKEMGIKSKLEPVLSFPLGSNVVSLLEATRMYEAIITGKLTTYGGNAKSENIDSLLIIDRIESEEGKVLYRPERYEKQILSEKGRMGVGHILENVVKFGTGRRADKMVSLGAIQDKNLDTFKLSVPLLGKTGTANRYTNASFFGYLPGMTAEANAMAAKGGYAVGAYVGYDDNSSMRKSSIKISGATGALPTWISIVNELLREHDYAETFDPASLSFDGLQLKRENSGQINLAVNPDNGGVLYDPARYASATNRYQPSILTFGNLSETGKFSPERMYEPYWRR
ncbi:transglycosylase domain-containing protein [Desulfosediminicola flagellatus]|uniref:transglycosylase domain-containing protein n=1 Tax=Desulfosediminicola flagellatus TaxID=2569541 RepID=UPI0010AC3CBE|nr:transglycosylase domain-containing protein [Desulfosediminicola flagellatus]